MPVVTRAITAHTDPHRGVVLVNLPHTVAAPERGLPRLLMDLRVHVGLRVHMDLLVTVLRVHMDLLVTFLRLHMDLLATDPQLHMDLVRT